MVGSNSGDAQTKRRRQRDSARGWSGSAVTAILVVLVMVALAGLYLMRREESYVAETPASQRKSSMEVVIPPPLPLQQQQTQQQRPAVKVHPERAETTNKNSKKAVVLDDRRGLCASTYSRKFGKLIAPTPAARRMNLSVSDIEEFVYNRMVQAVTMSGDKSKRCPPNLVINAAPGSSGTRSFFLATTLMNVPSAHFRVAATGNCSLGNAKTGNFMRGTLVYGDTPYSNRWWGIINACPTIKTVFTLVNGSKWFDTRKKDHGRLSFKRWPSSIPLPFDPLMDGAEKMQSLFTLKTVPKHTGAQTYSLFLDLVRCVATPNDLLVIDYTKLDPPSKFWPSLNSFLGAGLGEADLKGLIAAGLPYWGHSKCFVGSPANPCPTTLFKETRVSYKGLGLPGPCK